METFDVYKLFGDINTKQEKILTLLNELSNSQAQPKIYDLVELQEILKVSKRTIATWLKQGILPHTRVGAKIWVTETQLSEFLQKNNTEVTESKTLHKINRRA